MQKHHKISLGLLSLVMASSVAEAGYKVDLGDGKSMEIGGSIRAEFSSVSDGAPNGSSSSQDFDIHSARIYLKAKLSDRIGFNVQTEKDGEKGVALIDAFAKFQLTDTVQIWGGRFIPPSDRSNLSGSYNLPVWDYPGKVSGYPNIKAGRDDGIAVIGTPMDGKLVYALGVFEGNEGVDNPEDNAIVAGRLAYSFWDAEGYLTRSTYYGAKEVFTLGWTVANQPDSLPSTTDEKDFLAQNIDLLIEKSIGDIGVVGFEAALYNYDKNGGVDSAKQGDAYLVSTSYLFPQNFGEGKIQLAFRYQEFSPENNSLDDTTRSDFGVTYVMQGHNARVGAYLATEESGDVETDIFKIGLQLKL